MRVAVFSSKPYDKSHLMASNDAVNAGHEFDFYENHLNIETSKLAEGLKAICCFVNDDLSAGVLQALKTHGIKHIVLRCAGFNQLDIEVAKNLGFTVTRVPEYSPHAIAEHALALILALNRNIHRAHNRIRENDYSLNGLLGFDVYNKTVAVIGTGKIGQTFANVMLALGCEVIAYDPYPQADLIAKGVCYFDLPTLFSKADIISLHCPLTPATHHLLNNETLQQTKPGVMIINTSRGGLIDTRAIIKHLKNKHVGYVGLDVYEEESDLFFDDQSNELLQDDVFARLLTFPNVLVTGHQAFFTKEALTNITDTVIANLTAIEQDQIIETNSVL